MNITKKMLKSNINNTEKNSKEYIREHKKQYYEHSKEAIRTYRTERITCECGCIVTKPHLPRHKRSAKHKQLLNE